MKKNTSRRSRWAPVLFSVFLSLVVLPASSRATPAVQEHLSSLIRFDLDWLRSDQDFQDLQTTPLAEILSIRDILFMTLAFGGEGKLVMDVVDQVKVDLRTSPEVYAYQLAERAYAMGPDAWRRFQISVARVARALEGKTPAGSGDSVTMADLLGKAFEDASLAPNQRHLTLEDIAQIVLESDLDAGPGGGAASLTYIAERILEDLQRRSR